MNIPIFWSSLQQQQQHQLRQRQWQQSLQLQQQWQQNYFNGLCMNASFSPTTHFDTAATIPSCPDPDDTSALICKEMNALSLEERERILEEIHGVAKVIEETPELLHKSFHQLQVELDKIQPKFAYDAALHMSPGYVCDPKFRLMFLRAQSFDCYKAAMNIVRYFEYKLQWFGADKLGRKIQLSDLDNNDLAALEAGWAQILPSRDKAGRAVLWRDPNFEGYKAAENVIRSAWYLLMAAIEDEETQKRGFVVVAYGLDEFETAGKNMDQYWLGAKLAQAIPMRVAGMHFCVQSKLSLPIASLIMLAAGKDLRARARVHQGTETEWQYSLMTFGVPIHSAPVTYDGLLKVKYHKQWVTRRCFKENSQNPHAITIDLPARSDILIGKGVPIQQHSGNLRYQMIVDDFKEKYISASAPEKKVILQELMACIKKDPPARFLERDDNGWWIETSEAQAMKKIATRLRLKGTNSPTI